MLKNFNIACLDIKILFLGVVVFCVIFGMEKETSLLGTWWALLVEEPEILSCWFFDYCLPLLSWNANWTKSWNIWILTVMYKAPFPVLIYNSIRRDLNFFFLFRFTIFLAFCCIRGVFFVLIINSLWINLINSFFSYIYSDSGFKNMWSLFESII